MLKKYISDLKAEFKGYNGKSLSKDLMAGLTVAAVALPLALAFGVSSGADAAAGLITAIIAGFVIGLLSGGSYQISGPTGSMTAILLVISAKYGVQGVLTVCFLAGIIRIIAAVCKIGKLVSYIPSPVITGFTSGIALIIGLGQIDNFFGTKSNGINAIEKIGSYFEIGFSPNWAAVMFGGIVILIMLLWPKKLNTILPSSLVGVIAALVINMIFFPQTIHQDGTVQTIVKEVGAIPQSLMTQDSLFIKGFDFSIVPDMIVPAFSVAVLGIIESLLCGVSAGKMKNEKLDATRELFAQGIGNMIAPLFGGVPATAAIARTSMAIKSGGKTRLVSVFHSLTLLLCMFLLGGVISRIPLAALAGVLMVTSFRMNEWDSIKDIFNKKFKSSIVQYLATMIATVVFDLTAAIIIGVVVAMLVFVVKSCELSVSVSDVDMSKLDGKNIKRDHSQTKLVYLAGPLFFGTQEKLTEKLNEISEARVIILSMRGVPSIDGISIAELEKIVNEFKKNGKEILMCGVQDNVMKMLERGGFNDVLGKESFHWDAVSAIRYLETDE